jgi:2-methylcitrate dehydratase
MQQTLAHQLARFAISLKFEDLPAAVVHETKRRVLDSIGCAYGAFHAEPSEVARRVARGMSAEAGATLIGTRHRAPVDWAAFANGCMVRYLDYNDTYLSKEPAHPSDNIPAALAVAEAQKAGGRELITAIVLAYEVQCRLCDAACIRARGWDHVTYGAFSTALAAGRLMKLAAEPMRHAVGIAGVASVNLRQSRVGELSHWKGCAFANAARHGIYSAMLAKEGMTGPAPIFEGANGFEKLVSGPIKLAGPIATGTAPRGPEDLMMLKTSIKYWPLEYHAQSAVEASLELRKQIKNVDEIEQITVQSHDAAVDIIGSSPEQWKPTSRETADHSLPYLTAVALADGEVTTRQFEPQRYTDAKLLKLVAKVKVERNAELSGKYPQEVGNIVTLKLRDGKTLTKRVDVPLGNAKKPLSDAQVEQKLHTLADPVLGGGRVDKVAQWVWKLDEKTDVAELMPLLVVA